MVGILGCLCVTDVVYLGRLSRSLVPYLSSKSPFGEGALSLLSR